jgi:pimeloyl-ACP methyl ester carboxylesterase
VLARTTVLGRLSGGVHDATIADFGGDARAGRAPGTRSEIDRTRIGILGHSEGGIVAPLAAVQTPDVAFLILLAAPGLTGERLLCLQTERLLRAGGADDLIAPTLAMQRIIVAALRAGGSMLEIGARAREDLARFASALSSGQKAALGFSDAAIEAQTRPYAQPCTARSSHTIAATLSRTRIPVLALNGSRDLLVPAAEIWRRSLARFAPQATLISRFMRSGASTICSRPAAPAFPGEYGKIEETISPVVLRMVAEWILKRAHAEE